MIGTALKDPLTMQTVAGGIGVVADGLQSKDNTNEIIKTVQQK